MANFSGTFVPWRKDAIFRKIVDSASRYFGGIFGEIRFELPCPSVCACGIFLPIFELFVYLMKTVSQLPHKIITEGQWDCALFTTYALSLSFFEAYLLRQGLKKNGCQEIWIVADAEGYAQSLAERQAMSVGQDYRLIAVGLPKGVFHPKCTYLHGAKHDVLIVGSGNLTFGGYGKNVEVVEVFQSDVHSTVFAQFSTFLKSLSQRADFQNPDPTWIARFAELAAKAGAGPDINADNIQLLHCVDHPIMQQVSAACQGLGQVTSLHVLSPFFDQDAAAVRELVEATGSIKAVIGLLEGQENGSTFPFGEERLHCPTEAAVVEVSDSNRPLHAKWFEIYFEGSKRLTLTGSVNATHQSFCTTNNVEVGILRRDLVTTTNDLKWRRTKVPSVHVTPIYHRAGLGSRYILQASLLETGYLEGTILPVTTSAGEWHATLSRIDGESANLDISVGLGGEFSVRVPNTDLFDLAGGLQLIMEQGSKRVRGWVQNEWLLDVARIRNAPVASILRFLRNEQEDEDDIAVLEFLTASIDKALPALPSRTKGVTPDDRSAANDTRAVPVEALAPGTGINESLLGRLGDQKLDRLGQLLQRLFGHFERSIENPPEVRKSTVIIADDEESVARADDEEGNDQEIVRHERIEKAIVRFRDFIVGRLRQPAPAQHRALCNAWLFVELQFHIRKGDPEEAARFCRQWLTETCLCCRFADAMDNLDERVLAVAAVLGANSIHRDEQSTNLVGLHESLENYRLSSGHIDADLKLNDAFLRRVRLPGAPELADGLKAVFEARTRKQEIELVQQSLSARRPLPVGLDLVKTREGKALIDAIKRGRWPKLVLLKRGQSACPKCCMSLNQSTRSELKRLRFSRCVYCETFIACTEDSV